MYELWRPETHAVWEQETHMLPQATSSIKEFERDNQPTILWWDKWTGERGARRNFELSVQERNAVMIKVFEACGVEAVFHGSIRVLHCDAHFGEDDFTPEDSTFADEQPSPHDIFQWLGDIGAGFKDDPNDFTVGFAVEAPNGLVVAKLQSQEPFIDDDTLEEEYQIVLYPKDSQGLIDWDIEW